MTHGKFTWLPRCQYGVENDFGYERDCDEPAACHIVWGYSTSLYMCDEHAALIHEQEEADRDEEHAKYDAECAEARSEAEQSEAMEKAQAEGPADANEDSQPKFLSPFN